MRKKYSKKNTKNNTIKYINEDTNEIKKFALILFGIVLITGLLYFITAKYIVKDDFQKEETQESEVAISYDTIKVGSIFNRPYETYYVFMYNNDAVEASYYASLLNKFSGKEKIYFLNLSIDFNKKYLGEKSNKKATMVSELSLTSPTLLLIKNGKIVNYYDTIEEIEKILK